jgi:uncharacterized protein YeaO (DUF488 family)
MFGHCGECKQLFEPNKKNGSRGGPKSKIRIREGSGLTMFKTKSVHSPIGPADGLRILAARGRGRGLPADRFDVWMANLGPSEELRDAILAGRISWTEYSRRYLKELREPGGVDARNERIKNHGQKFTLRLLQYLAKRQTVTLLCHCAEEEKHCHRHLLKAVLEGKI